MKPSVFSDFFINFWCKLSSESERGKALVFSAAATWWRYPECQPNFCGSIASDSSPFPPYPRRPSVCRFQKMVAQFSLFASVAAVIGLASAQLQVLSPGGPDMWWGARFGPFPICCALTLVFISIHSFTLILAAVFLFQLWLLP